MTPRFSVVVPAYNASATLDETLGSIAAQTFPDWECVVVDDGSVDGTAAIVRERSVLDPRFRLVQQENRGTAGAYRTGVAEAFADLLVICSADDLLLPAHLETMDRLISAHPECGIFSSNGQYLDDATGNRRPAYADEEWRTERSLTLEQVIRQCFFSVGAVFRRSVYEITGGHRPGVYVDDYDLWLRAMASGVRHCYTPDVLSVHRVSDFQQSADVRRVWRADVSAYEYLKAEYELPESALAVIDETIADRLEWVDKYPEILERQAVELALEQQAIALRARVERLVGPKHADGALRLIHAVSWITRPFRKVLARRPAR